MQQHLKLSDLHDCANTSVADIPLPTILHLQEPTSKALNEFESMWSKYKAVDTPGAVDYASAGDYTPAFWTPGDSQSPYLSDLSIKQEVSECYSIVGSGPAGSACLRSGSAPSPSGHQGCQLLTVQALGTLFCRASKM